MNRGGLNIDYEKGFVLEAQSFDKYKPLLKHILNASMIEATPRSIVDKATGVDCYAKIKGDIYGVSLRVRNKDYDSFTLNRHVSDPNSEVNKWIKKRTTQIKPIYHVQIAPTYNGVRVWRINIDAFAEYLKRIEADFSLCSFYSERLRCYEFPYCSVRGVEGVYSYFIDRKK